MWSSRLVWLSSVFSDGIELGRQPESETPRWSDDLLFGRGGTDKRRNSIAQFLPVDDEPIPTMDTLGIPFVPIGPEVRSTAKSSPPVARAKPTTERMTIDSLTEALSYALRTDVAARAQFIDNAVRTDGAKAAARRLMTADSQSPRRQIYD